MNLDPIDQIKMYLRRDRHRIWGFVVYRCTYSSDEDWVRFMDILRQENRKALSYEEGGLEMWESLDMTVFEDRSTLDGASKGFVREQFREWCKSAPQQEQGAEAEAGCSQRYRYCLQVDEASLRSVVDALPRGGPYQQGFVNLINKEREHRWVGPVAGDYPEIEGSTEADTGWMRLIPFGIFTDIYPMLRENNGWVNNYERPPRIYGVPHDLLMSLGYE